MDVQPTALCQRQMDGTWQQVQEHQQQECNMHLDEQQDEQQCSIELAVVVHVMSDFAFKKYLQHCSASDLMLLRGMLLKVTPLLFELSSSRPSLFQISFICQILTDLTCRLAFSLGTSIVGHVTDMTESSCPPIWTPFRKT